MVEPISMAVGTAIGVAGLYSTCLQAIEDYQAVQNFESDSQWLVDLFEAERILLRGWGRRVGIENGGSQHPCLDASSEEYAIVKRLLEHIRQIWVDADAISRKYDIKLMGDAVAGGSYGFISFTPRRVSLRRKIVWASRDKAKYKRLVENLSYLTHKLNDIASISDGVRQLQCGGEGYRDGVSRLRALVEGDRKRYFDHIGGVSVEAQYRGVGTRATDEELTEFLSSEGFQSWFNGIAGEAPSSLLWLQGDAGVGKTVLTATLIENVKGNSSYPTAFFFCHYGQHPWNKTEHVLRSWIAQLARQSANAFEIIQRHFPESPRGLAELDMLWRVLSEITKTLDSCHLVLDALDECDGGDTDDVRDNPFQGGIGRFLQDLLHHTRDRGTKIFISSRRVGYFEALSIDSDFSSTRISLYPFEGRSEQNTRAYIDAHLINTHYSESDRRRLVDAIEKRCGGDRSWVSMELGYISWVGTTESIDQLLCPKLPTTEGLSMRIVEKICNLDGRDRELARNILEVAISSDNHRCYREPTMCNLKDVQRMHMRSVFVDVSTCAAEALRLCGPAVKMAPDGSPAGCVVFAHGFDKISLLKSALFGDISYQHAVVSNMALKWHLSPPETKDGGPNFVCSLGQDWQEMFQDISGEARVECLNHQRNLLGLVDDFREFAQLEYVGRASNDARYYCLLKEPVGELTPLTFACRHGLVEMFTELMANSSNIEPNLISVAAWNGRAEIVRILLSRGDIDPNTHSIEFAPLTPLGHAIVGRNLKVVEVLLDSQSVLANGGFRVEESPGDQVVCDACTRLPFPPGSVVDVFLSPLQLAIVRRYKPAIKLLLSRHKPAPRFRSVVEFHQIMLMSYATRRGYGGLVSRLLFGRYLDVNPLTKDGNTALDLAVSAGDGGDLEIWEMLKERGAWSGDDLRVWMRWYSKALRITFVVCSFLLLFGVCKYAFWPGGIRGLGRVWDGWSRFVE